MDNVIPDFLGETATRIGLKEYPNVKQFVVQHLYPDTLRLLLLLHKYVQIDCVIGIGYSGKASVVEQLKATGIRVLTPSYQELEECVRNELGNSLYRCRESNKQLMLHEVGGYAIKCLHEVHSEYLDVVPGAIEVTKQGVWLAQSLESLRIPQLNCAETKLKEIEGQMVGESVVASLDNIVRDLGLAMSGREVLLLGYGWVGKGAALSLDKRGARLTVKDTDNIKLVNAVVDGFAVVRNKDEYSGMSCKPKIVVGMSGRRSITAELIDHLPDKCFLVSGSSKDHEIDIDYLESITSTTTEIHQHVKACNLNDGRCLYLVNKGYPVNFTGSSVPDEIVEFLFSELIMLVQELLDGTYAPGTHPLSPELEDVAAQIWLDLR